MGWTSYNLDQAAHELVIAYRDRAEALNQAHKMRMTVAFGLERFWGEHLRLNREKDKAKSDYWKATWNKLVEIMAQAGVEIPNDDVSSGETAAIKTMADKLWSFPEKQRKVALAVLTQLCDCMVWWTQRYKPANGDNSGDDEDE